MFERVRAFYLQFPWLCLMSWAILSTAAFTTIPIAKPGCHSQCGNLTVPYPFGIGLDGKCSISKWYNINCNTSFDPPRAFLNSSNLEIVNISETELRVKNDIVSSTCYENGNATKEDYRLDLKAYPLVLSDTANKFTVVGCAELGLIRSSRGRDLLSGCLATFSQEEDLINGSCTGMGCCQTSIPKGLKQFKVSLSSIGNHTDLPKYPCSYAFIGEQDKYTFQVTDLSYPKSLTKKLQEHVPLVLEWFVGANETCAQAQSHKATYACQENTSCTDCSSGFKGYRCSCLPGFHGNPYLSPGCTDIDECADPSNNNCSNICTNTHGNYICSCPKEHHGDGLKDGSGCMRNHSQIATKFVISGMSIGFMLVMMFIIWLYVIIRRNKVMKIRQKFFEQNGGLLLKEQLSPSSGRMESCKIFTVDELKASTNNYSEDRILGKGGYGTVYKGILKDGCEVAIKKSKVVDQTQIAQFINEVVILTQINHRNVVKLLGCCLETEVPLLVYEFISNGTLYEHIHRKKGESWLTWANCIRISTEAADALAYLHSAASIPIFHRDVKSANILLDDSFTTKISDFGASRLVPIDHTQVSTIVQGTLGYLDPEYFQTSQLTEKSDVYSFGVVLAELLTRLPPLCPERKMAERNLASCFVLSMKEDRLHEIIDHQLLRDAPDEQLAVVTTLVKKCLSVTGDDRPTMKEVAMKLEGLKKEIMHPWAHQKYEESETIILMSQKMDLYPMASNDIAPSSSEFSGQHLIQKNTIVEMSYPR